MLSGIFGINILLLSLNQKVTIPTQSVTENIAIKKPRMIKALFAAVFCGSLTGIMPRLGTTEAAILATQIVGNIGMYAS